MIRELPPKAIAPEKETATIVAGSDPRAVKPSGDAWSQPFSKTARANPFRGQALIYLWLGDQDSNLPLGPFTTNFLSHTNLVSFAIRL